MIRTEIYNAVTSDEKERLNDMGIILEREQFSKVMNEETTERNVTIQYELAIIYSDKDLEKRTQEGRSYLYLVDKLYEMGLHSTVSTCRKLLHRIPIRLYSYAIFEMWRGICDSKRRLKFKEVKEYYNLFDLHILFGEDRDIVFLMLMQNHHYLYEDFDYGFNDDIYLQFIYMIKDLDYEWVKDLHDECEVNEIEDRLSSILYFPEASREIIVKIEKDGYRPDYVLRNDSIYGPEIDFILLCHSKKLHMWHDEYYIDGKYINDYSYSLASLFRMGYQDFYIDMIKFYL